MAIRAQFNAVFRDVNQSKLRYRILKGSAGSGKSVNVAQDYILKLGDPTYQGANLLVVRKVEESNKDSTFAELNGAIHRVYGQHAGLFWRVKINPMEIQSAVTGNKIIFRGFNDARQREKVKSITFEQGKLTWVWCEEATELNYSDVDILDDRLRGDLATINPNLYYQLTMTFNPVSATHWIKGRYFDRADPDVLAHHSTYRQNRFIDPAYHRRMERRALEDPEGYRIYGLGEWGETAGLVLSNWTVQDIPVDLEYYDDIALGQDFGYNHANAILLLGSKDGNVHILREVYVYEKDTSEIIPLADGAELPKTKAMYCDSAEPDRIKMWKTAGYRARPVVKEKTVSKSYVRTQIDWLKQRRIVVHPSCTHTIKELQQWRWKKDEQLGVYLDEPVAFLDDAMAALRYGVEGWRKPRGLQIMRPGGMT